MHDLISPFPELVQDHFCNFITMLWRSRGRDFWQNHDMTKRKLLHVTYKLYKWLDTSVLCIGFGNLAIN